MILYIRIVALSCLIFSINLFPQSKLRFQGAAAIPSGYLEDAVSVGYGGSINYSYNVFYQNLELSLSTGYYTFGLKENLPDYDFKFTAIPLLAGVRFNFDDYNFIPYLGIEAGIYFTEYFLEIDYGLFGIHSETTKGIHPGISPEIGFRINLSPRFDVDVNARYNRINTKYIARAYIFIQTGFSYRF